MDLNELYGLLPALDCKRLCSHSCKGVFEPGEDPCRYLLAGECNIYRERPMICRLWGLEETMWCEHGCEPEGYVSEFDAIKLLKAEKAILASK